jgi:hypothetical protein
MTRVRTLNLLTTAVQVTATTQLRCSAQEAEPTKPALNDAIARAYYAAPRDFAAGRWVSLYVDLPEVNRSPVELPWRLSLLAIPCISTLSVRACGDSLLHSCSSCWRVRPNERALFRRNGSE